MQLCLWSQVLVCVAVETEILGLNDTERIERLVAAVSELLDGHIPETIPSEGEWGDDLDRLSDLLNRLTAEVKNSAASTTDLARGNIDCKIFGSLISTLALKDLQHSLLVLSRETARVNSEDFGKNAAYLREFSKSLNSIVQQLADNRKSPENLTAGQSRELEKLTDRLQENQSQHLETEHRPNQTDERLHTVVEASTDAIIAIDARGDITIFNPSAQRMFGFSAEEVIGKPVHSLVPEKLRTHHQTMVDSFFSRGKPRNAVGRTLNLSAARRDGTTFPIELSLSEGSENGERFIFAIVRDISNRIEAEEKTRELQRKLERAERMQSLAVLAGGVAHDLNNELGPLVGYPELILAGLAEDDPNRKLLTSMQNAATRAASTIQDLLTLARRGRYGKTPTSLNDVVTAYLDSPYYASLKEENSGVSLKLDLDDTVSDIFGSAPHLSKAIMNLIGNAFDAMPEGGELHVQTSQQHLERLFSGYDQTVNGEYVVLHVRDTGMGIKKDDLDKIFEPYFSRKEMGSSGSGLGLAVVYGIVKDHDGFYDVFSKVGEGTEFVLYFPITYERHPVEPEPAEGVGGTESVLVIDDAAQQRELAVEFLSAEGYSVSAVCCGTEALEFLKKNRVDIVVMDMIMDRKQDGLDTFTKIRDIRPDQKAIIISGSSQTKRVRQMQRLGAGEYIRKPFTKLQLLAAVRKELDRRPTESLPSKDAQPG